MNAFKSTTDDIRSATGFRGASRAYGRWTDSIFASAPPVGSVPLPRPPCQAKSPTTARMSMVGSALMLTLGVVISFAPSPLSAQPPAVSALRPSPGAGLAAGRRAPLGAVPPGAMPIRPPVPPAGMVSPVASVTPEISTHQRLVQIASGHPVCIVVGEGLASEFVGTVTEDEGPFQDFVMGAQVHGTQKTKAHTALDFTPNPDVARMLFVLKGMTENDTIAQLPRAAVHSAGTFEFEMTKQIEFNGRNLRTWSPSAFMKIHQQNLGASTSVSNIPLLGPLANNIVLNVADQRKPVSEGIAAQRVTQQVAPQFNSNLDQVLAKLNEQLQGSWSSKMASVGMTPSRVSTTTTHDALLCGLDFQAALAEAADSSGRQKLSSKSRVPTVLVTRQLIPGLSPRYGADPDLEAPAPYSLDSKTLRDRACLLVHASLIQHLVDRFHLAGREMTDTQLMRVLGTVPADVKGNDPQLYTLILDKDTPLFAIIDDGELFLEIRVAIRPVIGPELPTQVVQLSIRPELTDEQIRIKPVVHSVQPLQVDGKGQAASPLTAMIRQMLDQRLKEFTFQRSYHLSRQEGQSSFPITIQSLTLVEGWLSATIVSTETPALVPAVQAALP